MGQKKQNFIFTFFLTLIILIVVIIVLEKLFGSPVAGVIGTITAGIMVKYFEKLDLRPTFSIKPPSKFVDTAYAALVSILVLIGLISAMKGALQYGVIFFGDDVVCNILFLIIAFLFDWGSFIFAGLLIGKIYPKRAITLTYIAAFASFVIIYPQIFLKDTFNKWACLFEGFSGEYAEDFSEGFTSGVKVGAVVGFIIRSYVAILFAKISAKRLSSKKFN